PQRDADGLARRAGAGRRRQQRLAGLLERTEIGITVRAADRERRDVGRGAGRQRAIGHAEAGVEREAADAVDLTVEVAPRVTVEAAQLLRHGRLAPDRDGESGEA